jgi:hypothetical protein
LSGDVLMECPPRWRPEHAGPAEDRAEGFDQTAQPLGENDLGSEEFAAIAAASRAVPGDTLDQSASPIVLGMYWPGGLVVSPPGTIVLTDGRGRRASVRINTWTGGLEVEAIALNAGSEDSSLEQRGEAQRETDRDDDASASESGDAPLPTKLSAPEKPEDASSENSDSIPGRTPERGRP